MFVLHEFKRGRHYSASPASRRGDDRSARGVLLAGGISVRANESVGAHFRRFAQVVLAIQKLRFAPDIQAAGQRAGSGKTFLYREFHALPDTGEVLENFVALALANVVVKPHIALFAVRGDLAERIKRVNVLAVAALLSLERYRAAAHRVSAFGEFLVAVNRGNIHGVRVRQVFHFVVANDFHAPGDSLFQHFVRAVTVACSGKTAVQRDDILVRAAVPRQKLLCYFLGSHSVRTRRPRAYSV